MGGLRSSAACALVLCSSVFACAARGEAILLDFQTTWCGACRVMEPVVHELAAEGFHVRKVDGDQDPELVREYRIEAFPTFVALRDGREVGRLTGSASKAQLKALLAQAGGTHSQAQRGHESSQTVRSQSPDSARNSNRGAYFDMDVAGAGRGSFGPAHGELGWESASSAPRAATAQASPGHERLLAASVRLRIQDSNGQSTGSGTIIDARDGEALILTCGHMFREFNEAGRILVDFFGPLAEQQIAGTLVSYDLNSDVALVRVSANLPFEAIKVAPPDYACRPSDTVVSCGCDNGADATARVTQIVSIDRYQHAPNLQVAFEPVQGRSGGGLFNGAGQLVGVCNAADAEDKQGLFAALKAVYAELDRAKLSFVYKAEGSTAEGADSELRVAEAEAMPETPAAMLDRLSNDERTLLDTLRSAHGAEVICLVRALDDPQAKSRVFRINRASSQFWRELAGQNDPLFGRTLTSLEDRLPETRAILKRAPISGDVATVVAGGPPTDERSGRIWPPRKSR